VDSFDDKKIQYILKNILGYNKKLNFKLLNYNESKIVLNIYNNIKINHRLTDLEKSKLSNANELLKLIQISLKKSKLSRTSVQFKYREFNFIISTTMIGGTCNVNMSFKPRLINKIFKYLIYTNKFDKLYDMLEKYYMDSQV